MTEQPTIPELSSDVWEKTPDQVKTLVYSLLQRVAALEEQVKLNSQNSNKPPSSDFKRKKKKKRTTGKKRGAQPGHKGNTRTLLPTDEADFHVICKPDVCVHCDLPLVLPKRVGRHQVMELPVIRPLVTEYQVWTCLCQGCGKTSKGKLPSGVGASTYGSRIIAMSALMSGAYHLSKRQIQRVMGDFFGVPMSLGTVSNNEKLISQSLEGAYQELISRLPHEAVLNVDETRFDQKGEKGWLWAFVGDKFTVFKHRENRRRTLLEELLGPDFSGLVGSDRYRAYEYFKDESRQACWAHLKRDFERWKIRGGEPERIGDLLLGQVSKMFELWHRVRDGTLTRAVFEKRMESIRKEVQAFLTLGSKCGHEKTMGTSKELLKHFESLWTFVRVEGVEPTNNSAERALRSAVIYRKRCFGVDSPKGARFVERLLSVVVSAKQQKRKLLGVVEEAIRSLFGDKGGPSLMPA